MSNTAQNWLDTKYPDKNLSGKIELYNRNTGDSEELTGELVIEGYVSIVEISFTRWGRKGKITKVTIANCPQVKKIKFDNNEITEIVFKDKMSNLEWLDLPDNKLKEIDISRVPNLERLFLIRNPDLTKIKGLENATRLEEINLIDTPGLNGQEIKEWKEAINSALGSAPKDGPLPETWKTDLATKLNDLEKRPTQDQLNQAVANKANEFKDYINPNDKAKLEEAAKNQGMKTKEEYDARPDTTLTDYQKLKDNQEKHKPEDLEHHKSEDLKPADYDNIKNELGETKNKLGEWEKTFGKDKSPTEIKKELESKPAGGSGTGATLTPEQQKKLNDYEKLERQKKWLLRYLEKENSEDQYAEILQEFNNKIK